MLASRAKHGDTQLAVANSKSSCIKLLCALVYIVQDERKVTVGNTSLYRLSPGCTLKSDKREFKVDVDDDDTEQQLSLKAVRTSVHSIQANHWSDWPAGFCGCNASFKGLSVRVCLRGGMRSQFVQLAMLHSSYVL